jgi:hypothetical protein
MRHDLRPAIVARPEVLAISARMSLLSVHGSRTAIDPIDCPGHPHHDRRQPRANLDVIETASRSEAIERPHHAVAFEHLTLRSERPPTST